MSTANDLKNSLTKQPRAKGLIEMIDEWSADIGMALPEHMREKRLARIAKTLVRQNPELAKCTPLSFAGALFTAAQVGIEPIAGRAFLLPFNNRRKKEDGTWHTVKECQFVMGYKGVVDLFYRHEKTINLAWGIRHQNDEFYMVLGTEPKLVHILKDGERGPVIGYWAMANLVNGGRPFHYMTKAECIEHGQKHSKCWITKEWDKKLRKWVPCEPHFTGPWKDDENPMCLKTVLTQGAKIWPVSIELQRALDADESVRDFRKGIDNVLDLPNQANWDEVEKDVDKNTESELKKLENVDGEKNA